MVGHFEESVAGLLELDRGFVVLADPLLINDNSGGGSSNFRQRLAETEKWEMGPRRGVGGFEQYMIQTRDPVAFQPRVTDIIKSFRVHARRVRHLYHVKVVVSRGVISTKPAEG